jgi:hypothetical protein
MKIIISLNSINQSFFTKAKQYVACDERTEFLNIWKKCVLERTEAHSSLNLLRKHELKFLKLQLRFLFLYMYVELRPHIMGGTCCI